MGASHSKDLLVFPVVMSVVSTDALDASQEVVQELMEPGVYQLLIIREDNRNQSTTRRYHVTPIWIVCFDPTGSFESHYCVCYIINVSLYFYKLTSSIILIVRICCCTNSSSYIIKYIKRNIIFIITSLL